MPAYCGFMNNQTLVGIDLIDANIDWGDRCLRIKGDVGGFPTGAITRTLNVASR